MDPRGDLLFPGWDSRLIPDPDPQALQEGRSPAPVLARLRGDHEEARRETPLGQGTGKKWEFPLGKREFILENKEIFPLKIGNFP